MHIKRIFIYNARAEDTVGINGTIIKKEGQNPGDVQPHRERGLRVSFEKDFETARGHGVFERLDSAFLDLDLMRGCDQPVDIQIYGRAQKVRLEIS